MNKFTEIIDRYLSGLMNEIEQKEFEQQLTTDAQLKAAYDLQVEVMKGIQRAGVKQNVNKGIKKASFKTKFIKFGAAILITAMVTGLVWVVKTKFYSKENIRYELNEENQKKWSDADKFLSPQLFEVNGDSDTVIETENGIVVAIPANAFYNKKGEVVKGDIELEIKEALNAADIMKAGLSTTSDGKLLETGGMFYINARQNGENLIVAKNKGLYVNVPTRKIRKDMMLFEGKRLDNGQINWVNPKPFENKLTTVDILSLNFYPPHFLDSLQAFGFDIKNKKLTDSIYYSLTCGIQAPAAAQAAKNDSLQTLEDKIMVRNSKRILDSLAEAISKSIAEALKNPQVISYDTSGSQPDSTSESEHYHHSSCEIDPSRIKAIWDRKFNNTLLATREFEERLQIIFGTCNASVLNLYLENLDKKMYELDSMAYTMTGNEKFKEFYNRRDGGVSINKGHMLKLRSYFEEKRKIYKEAAMKAMEKLYEDEKNQLKQAAEKKNIHKALEDKRQLEIFYQELNTNMDEAYRQLGKKRNFPRLTIYDNPTPLYYGTSIETMGWKNVDMYVEESTMNRTTLDYTDPNTGKKAIIKYEPLIISITDYLKYDKVYAYLLPDKLNSFQRINNTGNIFKENLNELFSYSLVIVGYKGSDIYYTQLAEAKPGAISVNLVKTNQKALEKLLKKYDYASSNAPKDLIKDLNFRMFEQKEEMRRSAIIKREEITGKLKHVVFPCHMSAAMATIPNK